MATPEEVPGQGPPEAEPKEISTITAEEMARTRALLRKVTRISLALVVVFVFVFWLGWVRAPSPAQICRHKVELVIDTVGEQQAEGADALIGQLEAKCVEAAERKIQMRGKIVYAQYAKCVASATTLTDAERC